MAQNVTWAFNKQTTTEIDFDPAFPSGGTLSFAVGQITKTITFRLADDLNYIEGFTNPKTFQISLSTPTNGGALASSSTLNFTLKDGDQKGTGAERCPDRDSRSRLA